MPGTEGGGGHSRTTHPGAGYGRIRMSPTRKLARTLSPLSHSEQNRMRLRPGSGEE